jgi:hypothetical protein
MSVQKLLVPVLAVVALTATGCGGSKSVRIGSDQIGCVYSSAESGQQFTKSIRPGESLSVGKDDILVLLPTGDQLYNLTNSSAHTPQAPSDVLAFTKGQTAVVLEGVLKFRFNTAGDTACRWYSKFGRGSSYGDLGFAAATTSATKTDTGVSAPAAHSGWYRFLAAAHGDTIKQVVHDGSSAWTWQQLAYGADPTVKTKPSTEPVSISYGKHVGAMVSKYMRLSLGADYFCGFQPGLTGLGATKGCPPLYFQVLSAYPRDKELAAQHDELKRLDASLTRQRQAAKLKAQNRAIAIASAKAQRRVLEAQIVNTRLSAQNDLKVQKCLILAKVGLDCEGKKQQIIVGGVAGTGK